jgi:3-dehydroquinate synthase
VAAGLCIIARAAERLGWASERIAARMEATIVRNGLPTGTTYAPQALAEAALADKKRAGDRITLVVPRKIGACYLKEIPVGELERVFHAGMEANA